MCFPLIMTHHLLSQLSKAPAAHLSHCCFPSGLHHAVATWQGMQPGPAKDGKCRDSVKSTHLLPEVHSQLSCCGGAEQTCHELGWTVSPSCPASSVTPTPTCTHVCMHAHACPHTHVQRQPLRLLCTGVAIQQSWDEETRGMNTPSKSPQHPPDP